MRRRAEPGAGLFDRNAQSSDLGAQWPVCRHATIPVSRTGKNKWVTSRNPDYPQLGRSRNVVAPAFADDRGACYGGGNKWGARWGRPS